MLQIQGLHKSYGEKKVLRGLDLEVHAGEVYGLLGPNGAGKSTTFSLICGLLDPDAGTVEVAGQRASRATLPLIGVVSQDIALYEALTAAENLSFFGALYGLSGSTLKGRVDEYLRAVGLSDRAGTPVHELSGGMRRRVHIAIALVHEPKLLLLDEPSVGLDIESRESMAQLVRRLQSTGAAILLATHITSEAETLCTKVGFLSQGRLSVQGSLQEVCARVPAVQFAIVQTPEPEQAARLAVERGATAQVIEGGVRLGLQRRCEFADVVDWLSGVPLRSLSLKDVSLEDAYLLELRAAAAEPPSATPIQGA